MSSDPAPAPSVERLSRWPAGSFGELFAIAVPMAMSASTQSLMHVVDRVFLTWDSMASVSAALPAGILFWSFLSFPIGVVSYLNAFVSQYEGAKRPDRVSAAVWQGIYFSLLCGVLLMLPALWSKQIFQFIDHAPHILAGEATYFSWLCMGGVVAMLPAGMSCFFSGRGQTMVVLVVNASSVLVNAVLAYLLIRGVEIAPAWGLVFPKWGIAGAAIATNLANCYATLCYAWLLYRQSQHGPYRFWSHRGYDAGLMRDLVQYGGPSGLQMFLDVAGFSAFIMLIGKIGEMELAATNIAFNLNSLAFTPVLGVGIAISTLVGQRIGERRPDLAAKSTWKGFAFGGGIMIFFGVIYVVFPNLLLIPYGLHADDVAFSKTKDVVVILLRFVALYSFFDSMAIVFGSAVRAAGDTVFSMVITFACAWGLLVLPVYVSWRIYHRLDLINSWIWCSLYVIVLGFAFLARFLTGRWKTMSIIHQVPDVDVNVHPDKFDSDVTASVA